MEQCILPLFHSILVLPKVRQAVCSKVLERVQRILPSHAPTKGLQIAKVSSEILLDQGHNPLCDSIRGKASAWRYVDVLG